MYYIFENWSSDDYLFLYKCTIGFFILFGILVLHLLQNDRKRFLLNDKYLLLLLVSCIVFLFGTRGITIGTDTGNYYNFVYLKMVNLPSFLDQWHAIEIDFLFKVIAVITNGIKSYYFFLFIIACIMNWALYYFVRKHTNNGRDGSSLILFLMFMSSFSMVAMEINIIRNGLSIAFLLIALYFLLSKQNKLAILFFLISFCFHRTAIIPIALMVIVLFSKKLSIKYYYYLYASAILLAFFNYGFHSIGFIQQSSFEDLNKLSNFKEHTYRTGFRLDFVLYNSFFLVLFLKFSNIGNHNNVFLIKYYILASIIFFMNFHVPHSDRFGLYSWVIIPLLLFNLINKKYNKTKLTKHSIVLILFFVLNQIILF